MTVLHLIHRHKSSYSVAERSTAAMANAIAICDTIAIGFAEVASVAAATDSNAAAFAVATCECSTNTYVSPPFSAS